ncbi:MAG: ROK family protein [Actinomycetota bacterium]|nr:ROK family protein [Actinomycetota bacterium]
MSIIFNYIRTKSPISRARISKDLGISAPAVSRTIEKLIEKEYVVETERVKTKRGKRPTPLVINKNKFFVLGIDLGKERLRMALANLKGEMIDKYMGSVILKNKKSVEKIVSEAKEFVRKSKTSLKTASSKIEAICIGVPAAIDISTEKVLSTNYYKGWEWKDLGLKDIIEKEFDIPVFVENDANLSAMGEKQYGDGKKYGNIIFIEISNGIGSGIMIDDRLVRGSDGSAGEIGFTIANSKKLNYKIKDRGFLEEHSSIRSIKGRAVDEIKRGRKTIIMDMAGGDINKVTPSIVCKAALKDDKLANDIITDMVEILTIGIINLILIVNPQLVVLGGDIFNLPELGKLFINPIKEKIKKSVPFVIPDIKVSSLGGDTCVRGASLNAIESTLVKEFPFRVEQDM